MNDGAQRWEGWRPDDGDGRDGLDAVKVERSADTVSAGWEEVRGRVKDSSPLRSRHCCVLMCCVAALQVLGGGVRKEERTVSLSPPHTSQVSHPPLVARSRSDYHQLSFGVHATVVPGHVHVPRRRCLYLYSTPHPILLDAHDYSAGDTGHLLDQREATTVTPVY